MATHEEMAHLAFAVYDKKPLSATEQALLAKLESNQADRDIFADYVRILRDINDDTFLNQEAGPVDEELVAAYLDGSLSMKERERTEQLFAKSPHARRLLLGLSQTLHDIECEEHLLPVLRYAIAFVGNGLKLIFYPEQGFSSVALRPALVLGAKEDTEATACEWTQQFEQFVVKCRLSRTSDGYADLEITPPASTEHSQVSLYAEEQLLQSVSVSGSGPALFERLAANHYRVEMENSALGAPLSFAIDLVSNPAALH